MNKKQYLLSLTCLLILLIPNIACMCLSTDLTYSLVKEVGYIFVVLFLLLLPMSFLKRRTYFIVEGIVGLFWMPIEVSSLYLNKMTISRYFIRIIVETNRIEAQELLIAVWPLVVGVLLIWGAYIVMVCQLQNDWMLPARIRKCIWLGVPMMLIVGMIGSYWLLPKGRGNVWETLSETSQKLIMKFNKIYPYDMYLVGKQYYAERTHLRELSEQLASFHFGITPKTDTQEEHYMLVLGEAARYDHFHINGYAQQTSPSLDTIHSLFSLNALYCNANLTGNSLPLMITRADVLHPELGSSERTIVEAFQEGHFQTAWLSNQPMMEYSTRIATASDYHHAAISGLDGGSGEPDSVLVDWANELFHNHSAPKTFYVLHMLGSHMKYDQRYPLEYKRFTPAIEAKDGYSVLSAQNKEKVINTYDNTILYTDHVLGKLIALLRQQKGIRALIYISDHGENLFDDEHKYSVHGTYEGTIYEAHVPCFIWLSEEFMQAYPEKVDALRSNANTQLSADVLFYSLADMGNLEEIMVPEKSIFSQKLQPQDTIRMMTGNGSIQTILP